MTIPGAVRRKAPGSTQRWLITLIVSLVCIVAITGAAALASDHVAWRLEVLGLKLSSKLPEIPFFTLVRWMEPNSVVYLGTLAELHNVNASITNVDHSEGAVRAGARIFGRTCAECHGENGRGRTGPDLLAAISTMTDWKFLSTVKWGRPGTIMLPQQLSDAEIWEVHAFLRDASINAAMGTHSAKSTAPSFHALTASMITNADQTGQWVTYAGNYAGFRHGLQTEISSKNVEQIRLAWVAQLPGFDDMPLESTPIVIGNRMFVTESPEGVTALDINSGAIIWQFHRSVSSDIRLCCGAQNRGVAVLGDTVFVATVDAHLVALDATTGAKRWDIQVADWHDGYSMTGAPLAIEDRIVVGVAGGDYGVRGFIAAYAAATGNLQWKFEAVPGPGQAGHESWPGDSWQHGGVATWATGSYDPALGLIYWGTGNPAPSFNDESRLGSDLYGDSVVAVDAKTGLLKWYYQFTPTDDHDWDATQQPVLMDIPFNGESHPMLVTANRNGFFYQLDRKMGQFRFAKAFAKQTWASGFTPDGHPIPVPGAKPSASGTMIWPASGGATNWWPPSLDPQRGLLFVPSVDGASLYFQDNEVPKYHRGGLFSGSASERAVNQPSRVSVRAIDVRTGAIRWDSLLASGGDITVQNGGVLSTAGNLVFIGYGDEFRALDAETGNKLWSTPLGNPIHAPAVCYTWAEHEYISVIAGRTLFTFSLPHSGPRTEDAQISELQHLPR